MRKQELCCLTFLLQLLWLRKPIDSIAADVFKTTHNIERNNTPFFCSFFG